MNTTGNDFKQLIRDIISKYKFRIILMALLHSIKDSPVWITPILTAKLIDLSNVSPQARTRLLLIYGSIMVFFIIQNYFTHIIFTKVQSKVARKVSMDLRIKICSQLQQLSILYHNRTNVGRLHSKIIRDIEVIEELFRIFIDGILGAIVRGVAAVIAIYLRAPVALIFFFVILFLSNVLRKRFRTGMRENAKLLRTSIENMSASVSNMMIMMPITRAHGLEDGELNSIGKKIHEVYHKGLNLDVLIAKFSALTWISFTLAQTVFLLWSVYMNFSGKITVGDIVMFNAFFASVNASINILQSQFPRLSTIRESLISINEILNQPDIEQNQGKRKIEKPEGRFEFKNVCFNYPGTDLIAINNISLNINSGQSVAFVGPSGCGKTTLLFLLLGFIRPTGGRILLDGQDMNELDLRTFRSNVGVVTQETVFFSGTIKENIAYGDPKISDETIIESLKSANAWDFINRLPAGINTHYGENGIGLSGGQKQRLAIARALIRKPKVLILDEATSNLDMESETLIQETIEKIMCNQTTFIVSHRLSLVKNVDLIVLVDKGSIIGMGTHNELMGYDNQYSRAFKQLVS